jgi:hypothetical protein
MGVAVPLGQWLRLVSVLNVVWLHEVQVASKLRLPPVACFARCSGFAESCTG